MTALPPIDIPEKLQFLLFERWRYKVAYGGRGAAKSWAFARACLIFAWNQPLGMPERILCCREVQKSIQESVHQLLSEQIRLMQLHEYFEILKTSIVSANGSEFLFTGLQEHTARSIKSFESVTRVWIEEAEAITKQSLDILIPTIRREGSEILINFNPALETDEIYRRFVVSPPPDAKVVKVTYRDNPWFPAVSEKDRAHYQATNSKEDYENIWEGVPRTSVSGSIYAEEMRLAREQGRFTLVPYDPRLKVHCIWDLGVNAIIMAQRHLSSVRVIDYLEDATKDLAGICAELAARRYNWGYDWLPHDGFAKDIKFRQTVYQVLKDHGRKVRGKVGQSFPIPHIPVDSGIRTAKLFFRQVYFNHPNAGVQRLLECLRRYARRKNEATGEEGEPIHNEWSHGADAFRYLALVADQLTNDADERNPRYDYHLPKPADPGMGLLG